MRHTLPCLTLSLLLAVSGCYASRPHQEEAFRHGRDRADAAMIREIEERIIVATNEFRRENHRKPLTADSALSRFSRSRSADMADRHYFSHTEPGGKGVFELMKLADIHFGYAAENIYMCRGIVPAKVAEAAMNGWIHSPGHRANMLAEPPTLIGVGVAEAADGSFYGTQNFMRP